MKKSLNFEATQHKNSNFKSSSMGGNGGNLLVFPYKITKDYFLSTPWSPLRHFGMKDHNLRPFTNLCCTVHKTILQYKSSTMTKFRIYELFFVNGKFKLSTLSLFDLNWFSIQFKNIASAKFSSNLFSNTRKFYTISQSSIDV